VRGMPSVTLVQNGYVLDTGPIIDLCKRYPRDLFPPIWEHIDALLDDERITAPKEVLRELAYIDDDALAWAESVKSQLFTDVDGGLWTSAQRIVAEHQGLIDTDAEKPNADPFVIALAKIRRWCVVTTEGPTRNPRKPHIPDVCSKLRVECVGTLDFLRKENLRLDRPRT
jgi:hypothetical protein